MRSARSENLTSTAPIANAPAGSRFGGVALPATPWGDLPPRMRVLFVTGTHRTGGWLAEAFATDSASKIVLDEVQGMSAGLARLRDDVYDAVLVSHEGGGLNALDVLDAIRAGSSDEQPIVVLGEQSEQEMSALCYESGGDAYVCVNTSTTRRLIWEVARAVERHRLIAENRRMLGEQRRRMQQEHDEAARLLQQQRAMIEDLERLPDSTRSSTDWNSPLRSLPETLVQHYRELLRAYVVMGAGNLVEEMSRLSDLLVSASVTAQEVMLLHVQVLEALLQGLGNRSARHVMNRADLLILEVMVHLADGYRRRYVRRILPPTQLVLPGFATAR